MLHCPGAMRVEVSRVSGGVETRILLDPQELHEPNLETATALVAEAYGLMIRPHLPACRRADRGNGIELIVIRRWITVPIGAFPGAFHTEEVTTVMVNPR